MSILPTWRSTNEASLAKWRAKAIPLGEGMPATGQSRSFAQRMQEPSTRTPTKSKSSHSLFRSGYSWKTLVLTLIMMLSFVVLLAGLLLPHPSTYSNSNTNKKRSWKDAALMSNRLVTQMTTEEKIGILTGVGRLSSRCIGNTHAVPRLGIPSLCFNDGPAGVRLTRGVTGFPSGLNTASTFSKRLMRARGQALGEEFREKGINVLLGPSLDIMRNPKSGRAWESAGPDPYLTGEFAYHTIHGIQSTGVQACAKHLIANSQEHEKYTLSADIPDARTAREIYWYPFERAIEANVSAVMCSSNRVNQTSACHNEDIIGRNGTLRGQLGFQGYVISDWGGTRGTAVEYANAGLDMEQPGDESLIGGGVYASGLQTAVEDGSVSNTTLDEMVSRVLGSWYKLDQDTGFPSPNFDVQHPDGAGTLNENVVVRTPAHVTLAREIGAASAVLLKANTTNANSSVTSGLPVDISLVTSIAVIGRDAAPPNKTCGNLNECNAGTMSVGWGSGSNSLEYIVSPMEVIASLPGSQATVTKSLSNNATAGSDAARDKDVAFVFVNAMSGELGFFDIVEGNMGDRNHLDLWFEGDSLVNAVADANANTIVVVHSVGPVFMTWSDHPNITGIIYAGAPGEQTGPSLADILFGAYNPRGRLPFSIADSESAYGTEIAIDNSTGILTVDYTEQLLLDYRYMDSIAYKPRYEFGFGLSYTSFTYSGLSLVLSSVDRGIIVAFTVGNSGAVTGTEIAQLYLNYPPEAGEPSRVLRGFEEILDLEPGSQKNVHIHIAERELSIYDSVLGWVRPNGTFTAHVGASIQDIRLQDKIDLG